jgi:type I restriction enzyme S subunit
LPEQRAIAAVLGKIQAAVEVQDKLVATLKELKAATMAKLFREGLRGERLKQTEIGEIPESWEVVRLEEIAQIGNGSTPKRDNLNYWEGGSIPWLTSAKVHESIIESADEFVTETARRECHLPLVRKDSLVVAITGQGKTLGNVAMVTFDTCVSQHLAFIQFQPGKVVPGFMLYFLQGRYREFRQVSQAGGSTKGALTCGFLKGYAVPVPLPEEQQQIATILGKLGIRLRVEESRRQALNSLFSSMLHLLMTGQVRVTPLL